MSKRVWMYCPKKVKPQISENKKEEILMDCRKFSDLNLLPYFTKKLKEFKRKQKQPYLTEIRCKWHGNFLYFIAFYKNTEIKTIYSECEEKFARLEYQGNNKFSVAYFRHTGQWSDFNYNGKVSLKECFKMILEWPHLQP
ncbi:MAG: hypothetical protein Q8L01_00155, partial [Candidatus Woesebacteria bacterium]|nr:hypothetical protein [Candidatus Woesebacteria bacterium]